MCSGFRLLPLAVFAFSLPWVHMVKSAFRSPDEAAVIAVISNKVICKEYASGWLLIDMVLCQ